MSGIIITVLVVICVCLGIANIINEREADRLRRLNKRLERKISFYERHS